MQGAAFFLQKKTTTDMNFIKQIERIKKMHELIRSEKTGTPEDFAQMLHLSRRQLYNELEHIKNLNATIKHCCPIKIIGTLFFLYFTRLDEVLT